MQHEAFANTEDFGGADVATPTQAPVRHEDFLKVARPMPSPATHSMPERLYHHQQQQQQQ